MSQFGWDGLCRRWLTVTGWVLVAGMLAADVVTMKDGQVLRGKVLSQDAAEVTIEVNGTRLNLPMSRVASVERESVADADAEAALAEIRRRMDRGDARAAWDALLKLAEAKPLSVTGESAMLRRIVRDLYENAGSRPGGEEDLAAVLTPLGRNLLAQAGAPTLAEVESRFGELRGARLVREAGSTLARNPAAEGIVESLREALTLLKPRTRAYVDGQLTLARALTQLGYRERQGNRMGPAKEYFDEAFVLLRAVREGGAADAAQLRQVQEATAAMQQAGIVESASVVTLAVPTPAPTPLPTPEPTPAPTPVPSLREQLTSDPQAAVAAIGGKLPDGAKDKALLWGGIALGFLLLWSGLSWLTLRVMEYGGNVFAARRKPQAKYLGPIAVVLALLDGRGGAGAKVTAKHVCPNCRQPVDRPELYADFNFSQCPHCKTPLKPLFEMRDEIKRLSEELRLDGERADKGAIGMQTLLRAGAMERLVGALIADSVRRRASDLHLEPEEAGLKVRQRIDGVMSELIVMPKSLSNSLTSAFKARANMDVADRLHPQDGSCTFTVDDAKIDLRVTSSPASNGEKVSLRVLDMRSIQVNEKKLGMTQSQRDAFERAIALPHGLILVTGPTGSGKTTTLYVALQRIRDQDKNIITIEDPIEFRLPGINQIQVNEQAGLTFGKTLRSVLRQDPDVIMVGEIRDGEAAEIAIEAATTGHLVFSTLHTIDSATAIGRLLEFNIAMRRISDPLQLVIAQRLIRLVCPYCRRMRKPTADELDSLQLAGSEFASLEFPVAHRCDTCNKTGYFGRTGLYEFLIMTDRIRSVLETGTASTQEIRKIAIQSGMLTIRQHGVELLKHGMTTVEELVRVTR